MGRGRQGETARIAPHLIFDSGAVIALSRGERSTMKTLAAAIESRAELYVPSVVVAETTRGTQRDAAVNLVLKKLGEILNIDEPIARTAARLLGLARSQATIDALVVACAASVGWSRLLTSDPRDMIPLARHAPDVIVQAI